MKALYPITNNQIKTISLPKGATNAVFENLFPSNKLPQVILIGLVDSKAFNASYDKNPYNFEHFDLTNLNVSVDQVSLEYRNLNLSFNSNYLLAFQTFLTGLNLENSTTGLNRTSYVDGNIFFAFQLLGYDHKYSSIDKSGSVKLELTFKTPLVNQVTGIVLAQSTSLMTIDKHRNVQIENQGIL